MCQHQPAPSFPPLCASHHSNSTVFSYEDRRLCGSRRCLIETPINAGAARALRVSGGRSRGLFVGVSPNLHFGPDLSAPSALLAVRDHRHKNVLAHARSLSVADFAEIPSFREGRSFAGAYPFRRHAMQIDLEIWPVIYQGR